PADDGAQPEGPVEIVERQRTNDRIAQRRAGILSDRRKHVRRTILPAEQVVRVVIPTESLGRTVEFHRAAETVRNVSAMTDRRREVSLFERRGQILDFA